MNGVLKIQNTLILGQLILVNLLMTNCAGKLDKAMNIAVAAKLKSKIIQTSTFKLQGFYRILKTRDPITIYIEGDGLSWLSRNQPSTNPTPRDPTALRLAAIDKGKNVVYLARPCQYISIKTEKLCNIPYWTHKRFAKEVVIAINEAINIMVSKSDAKKIHLVGYSGGGAIVAMVAAKRKDISSIRTVAGYMDHVSLNRRAKVSQLIGSLDPIKAAPRLKKTPQIHYSGKKDKRVPGWVIKNFSKAVGSSDCIALRRVNATHDEGWEEVWQRVWSKIPTCD
jgi:dienelactone hydrolase